MNATTYTITDTHTNTTTTGDAYDTEDTVRGARPHHRGVSTMGTAIIDQLNNYDGDNIWQDVIYHLPTDDDAIEAADPSGASNVVILTDGSEYRNNGTEWVQTA